MSETEQSEHLAPYEPLPPDAPGRAKGTEYVVYFHEGHSIQKHWDFMGGPWRGVELQHLMYIGIPDGRLDQVRRDPGVRLVKELDRHSTWKVVEANRSVMTCPGGYWTEAPGYTVSFTVSGYSYRDYVDNFTEESWSLQDHFAKIGMEFDVEVHIHTGYSANLTDAQIEAVFTDPNVHHVVKRTYGKFFV